jgi:hypothetical protein
MVRVQLVSSAAVLALAIVPIQYSRAPLDKLGLRVWERFTLAPRLADRLGNTL